VSTLLDAGRIRALHLYIPFDFDIFYFLLILSPLDLKGMAATAQSV
jgi:hypothetical protein